MLSNTVMCGYKRVVLEHHGDVAVLRLDVVDDPVADAHLAAGDRLQPGHHPQGGGLAAAGRPDEHEELAVGDIEAEVVDGVKAVLVDLVDIVHRHGGHGLSRPERRRSVLSRAYCFRSGDYLNFSAARRLASSANRSATSSAPPASTAWPGPRETRDLRARRAGRSPPQPTHHLTIEHALSQLFRGPVPMTASICRARRRRGRRVRW